MLEGRNIRKVLWGYHPSFQNIDAVTSWNFNLISLSSIIFSYLNFFVSRLLIPFSSVTSILGFMLLSLHNIHFYLNLMKNIREAIKDQSFETYESYFLENYYSGDIDPL